MIAAKRDNLCMNILRAKYKISNNWLRSDPPTRASPTWRAIEQAKKVVVKGACYSTGDGTSINIWEDPWVPWIQGFCPTPKDESASQVPMFVNQLIDSDLHCWKPNLVRELFETTSVQAILSIPLPLRPAPDKLIWIKILLWKIGVNALPTRENLMQRFQIDDSSCICCKQEVETASHLFLSCPASKVLWFSACWGLKPELIASPHPECIVKLLLEPPSGFETAHQKWQASLMMAFTLEEIWRSRNNLLHNSTSWDVTTSTHLIHNRFHEFSSLHPAINAPAPEPFQLIWTPPPLNWIKLNVDAALADSHAAIAVVARNHIGVPIKTWARIIKKSSPLIAETEALFWAVQLAKAENWSHMIFEGDSKICFDAINRPNQPCQWTLLPPRSNILSLAVCFISVNFIWVSRSCNGVAHLAAKSALESRISCFFNKDNLPPALSACCKAEFPLCAPFF